MKRWLLPCRALALVPTMLAFAGTADAAAPDDARRLVVTVRGDNVSGAGIVFALRQPFVYVVTADHVVRKGLEAFDGLKVGFESWPGESLPAVLLESRDTNLDVAVLRVDLTGHNIPGSLLPAPASLTYAGIRHLQRGAPTYPIGHPQGRDWFVPGSPAKVYEAVGFEITVESACGEGHSGGGLFDPSWRLLGMLIKTDDFVCTAVSFETVVEKLIHWRYPVDLSPSLGVAPSEVTRTGVVVIDAMDGADETAALDIAARLVELGHPAESLDVAPTGLAAVKRGKRLEQVLPDGFGYLLVVEMGELTREENPELLDTRTARLDLAARIFTADGKPFASFQAKQSGIGFSERQAAVAARDRAFADLVRQVGERLP